MAFLKGLISNKDSIFWEIVKLVFIVVVVVLPIRIYIAQPFIVSGSSMDSTFHSGDYLIIDEISYRFNAPSRGDVIVFRYPGDPSKFYIKRILGLPGETVEIKNSKVAVSTAEGEKILNEPYIQGTTAPDNKWRLADKEYFVMGDNRMYSSDSRMWGPLKENLIIGRALVRLWPLTAVAALPGFYQYSF